MQLFQCLQQSLISHLSFAEKVSKGEGSSKASAVLIDDGLVDVENLVSEGTEDNAIAGRGERTNDRKKIFIVGDSLVNCIQENGLNKQHDVQIKRHGGASTKDIKDHIKPVLRKKPNLIIVHAGTNDLTNDRVNTIDNWNEIIESAKRESPDTEIVFSTLTIRKDRPGMPKRVKALNSKIREFCEKNNVKVISNANVDENCLSAKKLHLNQRGNSVLARNFLNFISNY